MKVALSVIAVLLLVPAALFWPRRVETYRDKHVVAGQIRRPIYELAVHVSKPQYLVINGRTYEGVKGTAPFYLEVPQLNSILFVTEAGRGITFHLVNLETQKEISIAGGEKAFGGNIGGKQTNPDEPYRDFIEKADQNELVAATRYPDAKKYFYLDLTSRKLSKVVYDAHDVNGQLTNHSVYVNGELVK
jgi:hypothetical protein